MKNRAFVVTAAALGSLIISGCGSESEGGQSGSPMFQDAPGVQAAPVDASEVEEISIPQQWVDVTAQEWPDSAAYGESQPILRMDEECLFLEEPPEFFDMTPRFQSNGFGPFGSPTTNYGGEPSTEDEYRYLCGLTRTDEQRDSEDTPRWGAEFQLMVPGDPAQAEETVENFLTQPDRPERTHEIETIEIAGTEVHTVQRDYPNNDGNGGDLEALYYDEETEALIQLRIHSMDEELRIDHGNQGVAEDLVRILAQSGG